MNINPSRFFTSLISVWIVLVLGGLASGSGISFEPGHTGPDYNFSGNYSSGQITVTGAGTYYLTDNLTASLSEYAIQVNTSDVMVDGNRKSVTGTGENGIRSTPEGNNTTITQFSMIAGFGTAIYSQGTGGEISDNSVYSNGCAIVVKGTGTLVTGNNASSNSENGIYVTGNNVHITENIVNDNTWSGINTTGLYNYITSNQVKNNLKNGIACQNDAIITGNTVTGNVRDGILTWDNATISENTVSENQRYGMKTTNNVTFLKNTVNYNHEDGIFTGKNAYVFGNDIFNNLAYGLYVGNYATILDNNISSNEEYGLYAGNYANISDSIVNGNAWGGVVAGNYAGVLNNLVNGNQGSGIDVSNNAQVVNNTVSDNLGTGVFSLHGAEIHHNTITNNYDCGINGWGTANITDNMLKNSTYGLFLPDNSVNVNVTENTISGSTDTGIYIDGGGWNAGSGNIYNNNLINTVSVGGTGYLPYFTWTNPKGPQPGTNVIGGPYIAGNYWGNLNGTGWSDLQEPNVSGYSSIPYEIVRESGVYDTVPLVRSLNTISSTNDKWTINYPHGNISYLHLSNATYIIQAKPGADILNVSIDNEPVGPVSNWTFKNIISDHSISSSGQPTPGQVHAFFALNATWGSAPLTVAFTNQSLGSPTSYFWNFGDGDISTDRDPVHTYTTPGVYSVSLKAFNDQTGGIVMLNNAVTVTAGDVPSPTPTPVPGEITAAFSADQTTGGAPLQVRFTDHSIGNPASWIWDFGDGNLSTLQNVTHTYSSMGSFSVSLTAQNGISTGKLVKTGYIIIT
ncbi:right-handed parallel beta-helix repeat-containing protein [Methanospirillum lacunae]|uniref:PKD domain-containing protein n=1 Tax=Methanospirillum lacunae TaxID=668570 RepID=A0A2V2MX95_9EURY|nr:right-handed parallel beta-helix repeat-containing protein [Methanospirillum lacunae]PWR70895.1 hypothetical protein DK846_12960 [Methanospirillum lacunae]